MCVVEHEPILQRSKELSESTTSICLKLVDLEFALSFFVGVPQLTSWTQNRFLASRVKKQKTHDWSFAVKISLYSEIHEILKTDVSQEEGVWQFLHILSEMAHPSPPTELIRVSLITKDDDTADMQELLLVSHLCLMVTGCRTAIVSRHYAENELPALSAEHLGVVQRLDLCSSRKKCTDSGKVVMHACAVLRAFENLCTSDPEGTAKSWFRLCGALIAAIVVAIAELRRQSKNDVTNKNQLERVKAHFEALRILNESSPIFKKALEVLGQAELETVKHRNADDANLARSPVVKRKRQTAVPDPSCAGIQMPSPVDIRPSRRSVAPSPAAEAEIKRGERSHDRKRRKVARPKIVELGVIVPFDHQEDRDVVDTGSMSFANEHTASEQPMASYPIDRPDVCMTASFGSTTSTIIADYSHHNNAFGHEYRHFVRSGEPNHPPHDIYVRIPYVPYGDGWRWCQHSTVCSFREGCGGSLSNDMGSSMEQAYIPDQFGMSHQAYTQTIPATSFGSSSTMALDNAAQMASPYALGEITTFSATTSHVASSQAGAMKMGTPGIPPALSSRSPIGSGMTIDPTTTGYGHGNLNQNNAGELQNRSLQSNGFFPDNNGTTWSPSTLRRPGHLSHGFEQQFDRLKSPGMATPAMEQYACLPGSWG